MKKTTALTKSRSRRKATSGTSQSTSQNNSSSSASSSEASSGIGTNGSNHERRKPTNEEAALTAKNYRLAKELSELRIRHRDETKNVTRLTMENMNLASRCREAISHVAMLKKELAIHQRKNAELVAIQKQNLKNSFKATSSNIVGSENIDMSHVTELDNLMVDHTSASMFSDPRAVIVPQDQDQESTIEKQSVTVEPTSQKTEKPKIQIIGNNRRDTRSKIQPMRQSSPSDRFASRQRNNTDYDNDQMNASPHSSDPPGIEENLSKDDPNNVTHDAFGELHTSDFFHNSYRLSLETTPERDDTEDNKSYDIDDFKPFITPRNFQGTSNAGQSSSKNSGIDAFDASFMTTFPASFPTSTATLSPSVKRAFDVPDFPDEFFLGPAERGNPADEIENNNYNTKTDTLPSFPTNTLNVFDDTEPKDDLFPSNAMSSFEVMSINNPVQPKTPKHKSVNTSLDRSPPSNDKMRESQGNLKKSNSEKKGYDEHSPTLVLRRLQQRRAKERASASGQKSSSGDMALSKDGKLSDVEDGVSNRVEELSPKQDLSARFSVSRPSGRKVSNSSIKNLSAESVSDEIRNLDAIANGSSSPTPFSSHSRRRNIKQPVSYAEPSLNSKLRRGDVYFPKKGSMNSIDREDPEEPFDSQYPSYGKSRNKDTDEVLKDLVSTSAM